MVMSEKWAHLRMRAALLAVADAIERMANEDQRERAHQVGLDRYYNETVPAWEEQKRRETERVS